MLRASRADRFRLGSDSFVSGGPKLHRAGCFAFFAPMALRAIEALPHPAIIANENFFSHANLVSTSWYRLCQALFFGRELGNVEDCAKRGRFPATRASKKCRFRGEKRLASHMAVSTMRTGVPSFPPSYHEPNDCSEARFFGPVYRHWSGHLCPWRQQQRGMSASCGFV